jgi:hypothetical protein
MLSVAKTPLLIDQKATQPVYEDKRRVVCLGGVEFSANYFIELRLEENHLSKFRLMSLIVTNTRCVE